MYEVFIFLEVIVFITLYYRFAYLGSNNNATAVEDVTLQHKVVTSSLPIRRDGVIFITNAAKGPVREAAMELSQQGYHVVIGAKTKAEQRSFAYMSRKGIEILPFDLYDPSTYPDVIYRLRNIRKSLDRPVVGMMINLADSIHEEALTHSVDAMLDIDYVNNQYRMILKSPIRFTQAVLELVKLQQHGELDAFLLERNQTALPDQEKKKQEKAEQKRVKALQRQLQKEVITWNAGGFRIHLLFTQVNSSNVALMQQCGIVCVLQQSVMDYYQLLSSASFMKNYSISMTPTKALSLDDFTKTKVVEEEAVGMDYFGGTSTTASKSVQNGVDVNKMNSMETLFVNDIQWVLDEEDKGKSSRKTNKHSDVPSVSKEAKAIMHSFLSQHPLFYYDPEDIRNTYSVSHRKYNKGKAFRRGSEF